MILLSNIRNVSCQSLQYEIVNDTIFESDWEIPAGSTVIIKPGVNIQFQGYQTIVIQGIIIAKGTASEKIKFSSVSQSPNTVSPLSWKGFYIIGKDANAQFKHCCFDGAYKNVVWAAQPSFDSCEFTNNYYGLYCTRMAAPFVKNCKFVKNTFGITIDYATPLLSGNLITENKTGLYLQTSAHVTIDNNEIHTNGKNIFSEATSEKSNSTTSIQRFWNLFRELF